MNGKTHITSHNKSAGIAAHTASVSSGPPPQPPSPAKRRWWVRWEFVVALVGLVASAVTVLAYFEITPGGEHLADEKDINVTSINQSGGITAHTVNVGSQPRQMTALLGAQLKQVIPQQAKVTVTAVMGDQEAFMFADQVKSWLQQNGYPSVGGVNLALYSQPVVGQGINRKDDGSYDIVIGGRQQ
jgi:hypothetical protein